MICSVELNQETYELPPLTMALANKREKAETEKTQQAQWKAEFEFLKAVFGAETLARIIGTSKLDTCDLIALSTAFVKVTAAYDAPKNEAQREATNSAVSQLDAETLESLERMAKVIDSLGKTRQGFTSVR